MDFLGRKYRESLGRGSVVENLPGVLLTLGPIGSKAGKKGEMEKQREGSEDWEDGREK